MVDKRFHIFSKDICPKVKVITRLRFKLVKYDAVVHQTSNYTMETLPCQ